MALVCVLALVLLALAAAGQSFWWRGPAGTVWYGHAAFYWGVFFFALYVMWPTIKTLAH